MQPFYLEGQSGPLFGNFFAPRAMPCRGTFLFAPPFAEELNRSRHMMAALGRKLAAVGYGLLLLDVTGTGDSGGVFADGSFALWQDDLARGRALLEQQSAPFLGYIGLRTGALLAAEAMRADPARLLILWSPVTNGDQFLTQFLRLKLAEGLGRGETTTETTKDLKARLLSGETLEIGGYDITPTMAAELSALKLAAVAPARGTEAYLFADQLTPAHEQLLVGWWRAGVAIEGEAVPGPSFWSLLEPEFAPDLLTTTVDAVVSVGGR